MTPELRHILDLIQMYAHWIGLAALTLVLIITAWRASRSD